MIQGKVQMVAVGPNFLCSQCPNTNDLGKKIAHQSSLSEELVHSVHVRCFENKAQQLMERGEKISCLTCQQPIENSAAFSVSALNAKLRCWMLQQCVASKATKVFIQLATALGVTAVILAGRVVADKIEVKGKDSPEELACLFGGSVKVLAMLLSSAAGVLSGSCISSGLKKIRPPLLPVSKQDKDKEAQLLVGTAMVSMWMSAIAAYGLRENPRVLVSLAAMQAVFGVH